MLSHVQHGAKSHRVLPHVGIRQHVKIRDDSSTAPLLCVDAIQGAWAAPSTPKVSHVPKS